MHFASDNTGPVHPSVMQALAEANEGYALPYGADALTAQVVAQVREIFEAPEASVHLVALGTAANSLILATMAKPWDTIFCHRNAHIHEDECNAPEFFSGGTKLTLVEGADCKMTPASLRAALEAEGNRGVHGPQRGPVSITQLTEKGTAYRLDELRALTDVAHDFGCAVHMDGARFANAMVALGCSAAEMSWKSGIDALTFGGTKNGLMAVEAAVFFDPSHAHEFELRRKRGAHLFSKHRFLAAQMASYLADDLWVDMAQSANATCAALTRGLKQIPEVELLFEPDGNVIFATWSRASHERLHAAGAQYYVMSGEDEGAPQDRRMARLVCDWSSTEADAETFLDILRSTSG